MAPPATARTREPGLSMREIDASSFGYEQARRLLLRAGFGGTPEQIRTLASMGPRGAVDALLEVESIPDEGPGDEEFTDGIMREPTREEREAYRRALRAGDEEAVARFRLERQRMQRDDRRQIAEMQRWWLRRMIESPRPAEEKLTLFWHGHFATSYRKIENSWQMLAQNRLFRANAVGSYEALLRGIIRDPAMLAYLDNQTSRKERPNENLAREIMELFSLGRDNYTERDIREGARALSGYAFEGAEFRFYEERHDRGSKTILGRTGPLDGDGFVDAILDRPDCSRFMALKLYRFYVDENAPEDVREASPETQEAVKRMAQELRTSRWSVRPALRTLFLSEHFYAPEHEGAHVKSPVELVVGAVRSLRTPVRDLGVLNDALERMGQDLFFPPSVAGWEGGRTWINTSTLFVRQNTLVFLLTGRTPAGFDAMASEQRWDPSPLVEDLARTSPGAERDPDAAANYLIRLMIGRASPERAATVARFLREHRGAPPADLLTAAVTLITALPEYQLA